MSEASLPSPQVHDEVNVPEVEPYLQPTDDPSHQQGLGGKILSKAVVLATTAGILASGHAKTAPVAFHEEAYQAPQWEMTIPGHEPTSLHFEDLRDGGAFASAPTEYVVPNDFLRKLATTDEPFMREINLSPVNIKDSKGFSEWVETQSEREDLRDYAGVVEGNETPQQLINLATATVAANVDYIPSDTKTVEDIVSVYSKPMDENLETGTPLQCEGYSAATKAVFDELKKLYPETLKNTYLVTHSGVMEGHVWNLAVQVTSPASAEVAFADATESDPSYDELSDLNAVQFIEGMGEVFDEKGLIDNATYTKLLSGYKASSQATSNDKAEIEADLEWLRTETDSK